MKVPLWNDLKNLNQCSHFLDQAGGDSAEDFPRSLSRFVFVPLPPFCLRPPLRSQNSSMGRVLLDWLLVRRAGWGKTRSKNRAVTFWRLDDGDVTSFFSTSSTNLINSSLPLAHKNKPGRRGHRGPAAPADDRCRRRGSPGRPRPRRRSQGAQGAEEAAAAAARGDRERQLLRLRVAGVLARALPRRLLLGPPHALLGGGG